MSKKTDDLLAKAKSLNDDRLTDAIEALDFLGSEATANHQEFKDLEAQMEGLDSEPTEVAEVVNDSEEPTVDEIEAEIAQERLDKQAAEEAERVAEEAKAKATEAALAEKAVDAKVKEQLEAGEKAIASKQGIEPEDVSLEPHSKTRKPVNPVVAKSKKKLPYAGIKMIGNMFYSKKDNYAVGFATADECSERYNQ